MTSHLNSGNQERTQKPYQRFHFWFSNLIQNKYFRKILRPIIGPFLAIIIATLIGGILILLAGENPIKAYKALLDGAFVTGPSLLRTLRWTGPLIVSGLASAVAFRAGVFNAGVEGSLWVGGLAASLTGIYLNGLPIYLHIPLVFLVGALFGGLWAIIPAIVKVKLLVNEIVSTLMLNFIAVLLVQYLIRYHFFHVDPARTGMGAQLYAYPETDFIQKSAQLPWLNEQYKLSIAIFIALGFTLLTYLLFRHSKWGYECKMTGINPLFSRFGGVITGSVMIASMAISGALGGVVGSLEVTGNYHRFISTMSVGLGFDGISIAMMGKLHPLGILISSIFIAALKVGGAAMERDVDISRNIVIVIQGLVLLVVTTENLWSLSLIKRKIGLIALQHKEAHG